MGVETAQTRKGGLEAVEDLPKRIATHPCGSPVALYKVGDEMKDMQTSIGVVPEYKVGQKVWVKQKPRLLKQPSKKLVRKTNGQYEIRNHLTQCHKLKLPRTVKRHPGYEVSG